jgi:hypothetical protein
MLAASVSNWMPWSCLPGAISWTMKQTTHEFTVFHIKAYKHIIVLFFSTTLAVLFSEGMIFFSHNKSV